MTQPPLVLGLVIDRPAPLLNIALDLGEHGVQALVLHGALVEVDQLVATLAKVARLDLPFGRSPQGVGGLVAVAQGRFRLQNGQHHRGCKAANADEGVYHLLLFGGQLSRVAHRLPLAATALVGHDAGSSHAIGGGDQQLTHLGPAKGGFGLHQPRPHGVAGYGIGYKHHALLPATEAITAAAHVGNL